jgi:outer membrane protein assembly factor BamB
MRSSCLLISLTVVLIIALPLGTRTVRAQAEERAYSGVGEALRDWVDERDGWLSEPATRYLLKELDLDWKFTRQPGYTAWDDVYAYESANGLYFILVGARAGEFGQYGRAHYCLIDSSGTKFWTRPGYVDAPPLVSNQGTVALRYGDGSDGDRRDWATLRIDFVGVEGDSIGSIRWDDRIRRPLQRRFVEEEALFSPDGDLFVTTMNLVAGLVGEAAQESNNTFVFALRPDGSVAWEHYMSGFRPTSMEYSEEPCCVRLDGEWMAKLYVDRSFDEGYVIIGPEGGLVEKTITRHIDLGDTPE